MRQYCLVAIEKELARDETGKATVQPIGEKGVNRLASPQAEVLEGQHVPGDSGDEAGQAKGV